MECLNWGFPSTRRHPMKGIKGQAAEGQRQGPMTTLHIRKSQTDTEFTLCCTKWSVKIFDNYSPVSHGFLFSYLNKRKKLKYTQPTCLSHALSLLGV